MRLVQTGVFVPPLGQAKGLLPVGRRVSCGSRTVVVGTHWVKTPERPVADSPRKHTVCGRRKCWESAQANGGGFNQIKKGRNTGVCAKPRAALAPFKSAVARRSEAGGDGALSGQGESAGPPAGVHQPGR